MPDLPTPTSTIVLLPGPDWTGWAARYASRGYDVHRPADARAVAALLAALPQPPIVMGPPAPVRALVAARGAVAGVAVARLPWPARSSRLLRVRCTPGTRGWERAADRALAWAARAADR